MIITAPTNEVAEFFQVPGEQLDYGWSGEDELESTENVSTAIWTVPSQLTKADEDVTGKVATILLGIDPSAVLDQVYPVSVEVKTTGGTWARTYIRTFNVRVVASRGTQ